MVTQPTPENLSPADFTETSPQFSHLEVIQRIPELTPLLRLDGTSVSFSWLDQEMSPAELAIATLEYRAPDPFGHGLREHIGSYVYDPIARQLVGIIDFIIEKARQQLFATALNAEDRFYDDVALLSKLKLQRQTEDSTHGFSHYPFEVVRRFRKTLLSQLPIAIAQMCLYSKGIEHFGVSEDSTISSIPKPPFAKSAYFRLSTPHTQFLAPVQQYGRPVRADGHLHHFYQVENKLSSKQLNLLLRTFSKRSTV